jgi:hypothetical protein
MPVSLTLSPRTLPKTREPEQQLSGTLKEKMDGSWTESFTIWIHDWSREVLDLEVEDQSPHPDVEERFNDRS